METRLTTLRAFCHVAELGSLAAASAAMNLTASAISRLLSQLEAHTSLSLFDRSERRLRLTPDGELYFQRAREALSAFEDLSAFTETMHRRPHAPQLRIAALSRHAETLVVPAVARVRAASEAEIRFRIDVHAQRDFVWSSRTRPFHIGIGHLERRIPGLRFEPIVRVPLVAVVPRRHRLARRERVTAKDIAGERLVLASGDTSISRNIAVAAGAVGLPEPSIEASTSGLAVRLVALGLGIHLTDALAAQAAGSECRLVPLSPGGQVVIGSFGTERHEQISDAASRLIQAVGDVARQALSRSRLDGAVGAD